MRTKQFIQALSRCLREEEVKAAYVAWLELAVSTEARQDLVTEDAVWEFKHEKAMEDAQQLARILAQACYYLRRAAREGSGNVTLPKVVICADINQATIVASKLLEPAFDLDINWKAAASSPVAALIAAMVPVAADAHIFNMTDERECDGFAQALKKVAGLEAPKRVVTMLNLEDAYAHWCTVVGSKLPENVRGPAFVADLSADPLNTAYSPARGKLQLTVNGQTYTTAVKQRDYDRYWSIWDRPPEVREFQRILKHTDRLQAMQERRVRGVFYTPANVARLGLEYLEKELGADWEDRYWVWDPCCGSGELTRSHRRPDRCFLSTIDQAEIDLITEYSLAEGIAIFQYDYVNDDIDKLVAGDDLLGSDWKLPESLRRVLKYEPEKLVILMNPPYAECGSGAGGSGTKDGHKAGVADHKAKAAFGDTGKAARELYTQFLLRSNHHKAAVLAVFSKLKLTNTVGYAKVRELMPYYCLTCGFLIHSKVFHGVKGAFPVGFHVMARAAHRVVNGYCGHMDIIEQDVTNLLTTVGTKHIGPAPRRVLNQWTPSPQATSKALPLTSALQVGHKAWKTCNLSEGAIGYMVSGCNDPQHTAQETLWLSSVYADPKGWSLTKDNFRKSAMIFAVRKVVKPTWLNDRDQFTVPEVEPDDTFYGDCLVYALLHGSNQTSALKDVVYKDTTYQIRNQFYPYRPEVMLEGVKDIAWANQLTRARPTFVCQELERLEQANKLSPEAWDLLLAGKAVYHLFNAHIGQLDKTTWKLDYWDAGWYQVRNALKAAGLGVTELAAVKDQHTALGSKLCPQVYTLGFLRP
jgi:hypothetical protein